MDNNIITIKWDMEEKDLLRLRTPVSVHVVDDYCGGLFAGNIKVEFIWDGSIGCRVNAFIYGIEGYDYIGNVPYNECFEIWEHFNTPDTDSMPEFYRLAEEELLRLLLEYPYLLHYACGDTDPFKWYADRYYIPSVSRTTKHTVNNEH